MPENFKQNYDLIAAFKKEFEDQQEQNTSKKMFLQKVLSNQNLTKQFVLNTSSIENMMIKCINRYSNMKPDNFDKGNHHLNKLNEIECHYMNLVCTNSLMIEVLFEAY